jgi:phage/conjugal plasmid C-4 type zinc finger TraR family protein
MDEADKAQDEVDQQLTVMLANKEQERKIKQARPPVEECIDCGDLIPIARRLAMPGCHRCITCKENFELQQRRGKNA